MRTVLGFLLCLTLAPASALADCADGESEQCLMGICACVPTELYETSVQASGLLLERWLIESRNQSRDATKPVPAEIRAALKPFVSPEVLKSARYRIDDDTEFSLAHLNLHYGDMVGNRVIAVTLVDVIVFRDEGAAADLAVWAHELHHVQQFRDWGTREFAMRYVRDFHQVEDPAYAFEARVHRN